MNTICIALEPGKVIDCAKLCSDIQTLVSKELSLTNTDLVLSICLRKITAVYDTTVPKLTN